MTHRPAGPTADDDPDAGPASDPTEGKPSQAEGDVGDDDLSAGTP